MIAWSTDCGRHSRSFGCCVTASIASPIMRSTVRYFGSTRSIAARVSGASRSKRSVALLLRTSDFPLPLLIHHLQELLADPVVTDREHGGRRRLGPPDRPDPAHV